MTITEWQERIDGNVAFNDITHYINSMDGVRGNLTIKTIEDYSKKIALLENDVRASGQDVTSLNLAAALEAKTLSGEYAQVTIRSMKAALIFYLCEQA